MRYALFYLLVVNLMGAGLTALDKWKARRGRWRVPEKTLFLFGLLGGCPGVYLAMRLFHHKTRHKRFVWGIPAIFLLQLALAAVLYRFRFF